MKLTIWQSEMFPWYVLLAYWAVSALRLKQIKVNEDIPGRSLHVALMVLAAALMFSPGLAIGPLGHQFVSQTAWLQEIGVVFTWLGVALAVRARYCIGQYWSGRVTLKVDHQLIQSGPYARIRHPIYTGLLLGLAGLALVVGEWRCVIGLVLASIELSRKAAKEEQLLLSEFGISYQAYRQRTGFLVPRF